MKSSFVMLVSAFVLAASCSVKVAAETTPCIEVSGSATLNIVPDRMTVRIGIQEYYRHNPGGDSVLVRLADIDKKVRNVLKRSDVADSMITVNDYGNYANRYESKKFLMAKSMDVKLSSFAQLERIVSYLPKEGITGFNISAVDNSDMARYNREGLKSALDAARAKAEFIAANEGLTIYGVLEIIETTPERYSMPVFSNVAYDGGSGMDNMRRIVRTYSVKVKYLFR